MKNVMRCCKLSQEITIFLAIPAAGIDKALPRLRDELPLHNFSAERKFQNAKCRGIAQFAVGLRLAKGRRFLPPVPATTSANAPAWNRESLPGPVERNAHNHDRGQLTQRQRWLHRRFKERL